MTRISYWAPFQEKRMWLSVFLLLLGTHQIMSKCPKLHCESEWGVGSLSAIGDGYGAPGSAQFGGSFQFSYPETGHSDIFLLLFGNPRGCVCPSKLIWLLPVVQCPARGGVGAPLWLEEGTDSSTRQPGMPELQKRQSAQLFSASYVPSDMGASFPPRWCCIVQHIHWQFR